MALQGSGAITLAQIAAEFGGAAPHSLSEYYRGGLYVPDIAANVNIPSSGAIGFNMFYGGVQWFVFNAAIASNTTNYNLRLAASTAGWNGISPLNATVTINAGIYVYASTTGVYGFYVSDGVNYPVGSIINIINNGFILGCGGGGGTGGAGAGYATWGTPGPLSGGPAMYIMGNALGAAINITNNNTIGGGGGGGTGGPNYTSGFNGGGGGGGAPNGLGGPGGGIGATAGTAASLTTPGVGGIGQLNGYFWWTGGAAGGTYGVKGGDAAYGWGIGAQAGPATSGAANATWLAVGTRLGAIG